MSFPYLYHYINSAKLLKKAVRTKTELKVLITTDSVQFNRSVVSDSL